MTTGNNGEFFGDAGRLTATASGAWRGNAGGAPDVTVVGAGMAGSEAAWQLAEAGLRVALVEMKPAEMSPAHQTPLLGELVCSNSLRSDDPITPAGLLKHELRGAASMVIACADANRVPAMPAPTTVTSGAPPALPRHAPDAVAVNRPASPKNSPLLRVVMPSLWGFASNAAATPRQLLRCRRRLVSNHTRRNAT